MTRAVSHIDILLYKQCYFGQSTYHKFLLCMAKYFPPPRMIRVEKVEQSFKLITVGILDISIGEEGRDLTL